MPLCWLTFRLNVKCSRLSYNLTFSLAWLYYPILQSERFVIYKQLLIQNCSMSLNLYRQYPRYEIYSDITPNSKHSVLPSKHFLCYFKSAIPCAILKDYLILLINHDLRGILFCEKWYIYVLYRSVFTYFLINFKSDFFFCIISLQRWALESFLQASKHCINDA